MKKRRVILIVCILIAVLLVCVIPIPQKLKDGGTIYLTPIIPIYEVYLYNAEMGDEDEGGIYYQKGYGIYFFGIEICDNIYYESE